MEQSNVKGTVKEYEARSQGRKLKIGVGLDGSEVCEKAFEIACRMLHQKERKDRLYGLHIAPYRGKVANPLQKAERIQSEYERAAFNRHVEMTFYAREKKEDDKTAYVLVDLAEEMQLDMLVVGEFGRKAEVSLKEQKSQAAKEPVDHIGSVADASLHNSNMSVTLVKVTSFKLEKNMTYLFATDNGRSCQIAFARLILELVQPGDTVLVLMCHDESSSEAILKPYEEVMKQRKVQGRTIFYPDSGKESVSTIVMKQSEDLGADAIVVGIASHTDNRLGSVSDEIIKRSKVSVVCLKDPYLQQDAMLSQGTLTA